MCKRNEFVSNRMRSQLHEAGLKRPVLLDCTLTGESPIDIVIGPEHRRNAPEILRLVALKPPQFAADQLLVDAVARLDQKESFVDLCPQRSYLRTAATVALLDAR